MRSLLLGLLVLVGLLEARAHGQRGFSEGLDPRTYRSASDEFELYVDPSARDGSGPATYRLSRRGSELWKTVFPYSWRACAVCDDGTSVGYAYSAGSEGFRFDDLGTLVISVLTATGDVRDAHKTPRVGSRYPDAGPTPAVCGLLLMEDRDRFVVRVGDEDLNRQSEAWWPFQLSTGAPLAPFRPKEGQVDAGALRYVMAAVRVRETPLVLVQWFQYGEWEAGRETPAGTRFALVDEAGTSVWTLDLPDDYTRADPDAMDELLDALRERENGTIARCDEVRRFDLDLLKDSVRVTFEVASGPKDSWTVREMARKSLDSASPPQEEPKPAEAAPAPRPLALAGVLDLETARAPRPFVGAVHAFDFDREGNVAFLHWEQNPYRAVLSFADARGARIAEHELPSPGEASGSYQSDVDWLADDRFLVGWSAYSSAHPGTAKVHSISARTGEAKLLVADIGYKLNAIASFRDGRFVALGDNRLDAFDADGKRLWKLASADGLCGAEYVAVLEGGRVVVLDRSGIQWISANGKLGRYVKLEELWGREPRYPCGLEAGLEGGLVIDDMDRYVHMDAGGKPVAELVPRFRDGRTARFRGLRAGPSERLWTSDGYAILGLDGAGQVEVVLGEGPDVQRLGGAAVVEIDRDDRVLAAAGRNGDVHVIDVDGGLVRVLRPEPGDFVDGISLGCLSVDDEGAVRLTSDGVAVSWNPDGTRAGVVRARQYEDVPLSIPQPGTKNRVAHQSDAWELVDSTQKTLARFQRKPDGQWLKAGRPRVAPDGTIAFFAEASTGSEPNAREAVIYAADGTPRKQIPLVTEGMFVNEFAYDGARVVLVVKDRLHVHDVATGAVTIYALPGLEGLKTEYWTPFLPRKRAEVWLFDHAHTLRRYALPRG